MTVEYSLMNATINCFWKVGRKVYFSFPVRQKISNKQKEKGMKCCQQVRVPKFDIINHHLMTMMMMRPAPLNFSGWPEQHVWIQQQHVHVLVSYLRQVWKQQHVSFHVLVSWFW
jgi:hypothetical protein